MLKYKQNVIPIASHTQNTFLPSAFRYPCHKEATNRNFRSHLVQMALRAGQRGIAGITEFFVVQHLNTYLEHHIL